MQLYMYDQALYSLLGNVIVDGETVLLESGLETNASIEPTPSIMIIN